MNNTITTNEKQLMDDITAGMEIERLYYPDAVIESAALVYPLYRKNAEASVVLRDKKGQPVGFISSFPVTDAVFEKFCSGCFDDFQLGAEDVLSFEDGKSYKIYFCSIALHPEYKGKPRTFYKLYTTWVDRLNELYQKRGIKIDVLFGDAVTGDGAMFARMMGGNKVCDTNHSSAIYARLFSGENYEKELRSLVFKKYTA